MASQGAELLKKYLNGFGNAVAVSEEQERKAREVMQKVVKKIQENSKYKPARVRPAGSLEKGTALAQYMDVDLVLYLNSEPPFEKAISDWEDIVLLNFEIDKDTKAGSRSLQFALEGIGIDIVPAYNTVPDLQPDEDVIDAQYSELLHYIDKQPDPVRAGNENSAGFCEATVKFLKRQSADTHRLIRLCKFWNLTIYSGNYISGRSSVIELLAIHASIEEEERSEFSWSILSAFRRFLRMWRKLLEGKRLPINEDFAVYPRSKVSKDLKNERPLLMDPANPWNNRLKRFSPDDLQLFYRCAKKTLQRLDYLENGSPKDYGQTLHQLFRLQQDTYELLIEEQPFENARKWLLGTQSNWALTLPTVQQRKNGSKMHEVVLKLFAAVIKLGIVQDQKHAQDQSAEASAAEHAEKTAQKFVDDVLGVAQHWVSSTDSHETYDVTYNVPLCDSQKRVVRISALW